MKRKNHFTPLAILFAHIVRLCAPRYRQFPRLGLAKSLFGRQQRTPSWKQVHDSADLAPCAEALRDDLKVWKPALKKTLESLHVMQLKLDASSVTSRISSVR